MAYTELTGKEILVRFKSAYLYLWYNLRAHIYVFFVQDEDGRCYSDSFQDMPTAMKQESVTDGEPIEIDKPTHK